MNYYRGHYKWELRFNKKLFRDYYEKYHLPQALENRRYDGMRKVMLESWEEASGTKYEASKKIGV